MTRVHHVITRLIVGGAQENTVLSCRGLAERGWDVTLLAGPETGAEGDLAGEARAAGIRVEIVPSLRRAPGPLRDPRALRALRRYFERERPDIVHTHSSKAGILGRMAAARAGVPIVIHTNHGLPFHRHQAAPVRWFYRAIERHVRPLTHRIVCVSEAMRRASIEAKLAAPETHVVIRSGMHVDRFLEAGDGAVVRERYGIPAGAPVLGTVARFAAQKSPGEFLELSRRVLEAAPGAHVLWVGDGPLREAIEAQALPGMHFAGLVAPERVAEHLAAMDVVAMTSLWEGLPRVSVQAGLAGRPVVAYAADGIDEVVREGETGLVVPGGDVGAMARKVLEILSRPDRGRAMGEAARSGLAAAYDWRRMVDGLEALYREELARRGLRGKNGG